LFLLCSAFFTSLSYIFGKAINDESSPEATVFFWFFGAFLCSLLVVIWLPSQRLEIRGVRRYFPIFVYSSILTAVGAALWISSIWIIGPPLTSFLMKSQTLFTLMLGFIFLGERLNTWNHYHDIGSSHRFLPKRGISVNGDVAGSCVGFFLLNIVISYKEDCAGFKYAHGCKPQGSRRFNSRIHLPDGHRYFCDAQSVGCFVHDLGGYFRSIYRKNESVPIHKAS
jgi:uncharacterized membrane protein